MSGFRRAKRGSSGKRRGTSSRVSKQTIERTKAMRTANSNLFDEFADEDDPECMLVDGVVALCEQLNIDPASDVQVLVLFWKFRASTQATLTREEFVSGMTALGCTTVSGLQATLPSLLTEAYSPECFSDFFKFVFEISRDGTESTLDFATVDTLLGIVYGHGAPTTSPHIKAFSEFLQLTPEKRFRRDDWSQFREFTNRVAADVSDFDEDGAWPSVYDDYVDWYNSTRKK